MDYNNGMNDPEAKDLTVESTESAEMQNRRELAAKLGKYAIYAAPFTVLALNSKAATSSGPRKHKAG
jgi:hypothetical protein